MLKIHGEQTMTDKDDAQSREVEAKAVPLEGKVARWGSLP